MPLYGGSMGEGLAQFLQMQSALDSAKMQRDIQQQQLIAAQRRNQAGRYLLPALEAMQGGGAGTPSGIQPMPGGTPGPGDASGIPPAPYRALPGGGQGAPAGDQIDVDPGAAPDGTKQAVAGQDHGAIPPAPSVGGAPAAGAPPGGAPAPTSAAPMAAPTFGGQFNLQNFIKGTVQAGVPPELVPDVLEMVYPFVSAEQKGQIEAINLGLKIKKESDDASFKAIKEQIDLMKQHETEWRDRQKDYREGQKITERAKLDDAKIQNMRQNMARLEGLARTSQKHSALLGDAQYRLRKDQLDKAIKLAQQHAQVMANSYGEQQKAMQPRQDQLDQAVEQAWAAYNDYVDQWYPAQEGGQRDTGVEPYGGAGKTRQGGGTKAAPQAVPKCGEVVDGYRFNCKGDPNDPKSWDKVK